MTCAQKEDIPTWLSSRGQEVFNILHVLIAVLRIINTGLLPSFSHCFSNTTSTHTHTHTHTHAEVFLYAPFDPTTITIVLAAFVLYKPND
jgi:hypothetical protein